MKTAVSLKRGLRGFRVLGFAPDWQPPGGQQGPFRAGCPLRTSVLVADVSQPTTALPEAKSPFGASQLLSFY